ncbi:hypothetical protein [Mucisphaera sp.]|uniref:hypothetical protein n=1 Tax=Mucisphaera sp. TaxID=2913024 RepID=UPI003D102736
MASEDKVGRLLDALLRSGAKIWVDADRLHVRCGPTTSKRDLGRLSRLKYQVQLRIESGLYVCTPPVDADTGDAVEQVWRLIESQKSQSRRIALRDAFEERVAICLELGDMALEQAEEIALAELEKLCEQ